MNELLRVTNLHGESHLLGVKNDFFRKMPELKYIYLFWLHTGIKKGFCESPNESSFFTKLIHSFWQVI